MAITLAGLEQKMAATQKKMGEEKTSPRVKPPRLNVVLSQADKDRIDRLVKLMEADTVTDVTKDAFRLLEFFLRKAEGGSKFLIQDPGQEPANLEIFGVTTK